MQRILVVAPGWVGDMMMAQSLFIDLFKRFDSVQLDILGLSWAGELAARMPQINKHLDFSVGHGQLALRQRYDIAAEIRENEYDRAIVLPNSFKSALIPWLANIPLRSGWLGEMRWGMLNDVRKLNKQALPTLIQRYVALGHDKRRHIALSDCPLPQLQVHPEVVAKTLEHFSLSIDRSKLIIGLCPGAAFGWAKRWPGAYFAQLAKDCLQRGWQVWLFGASDDKPIAQRIQQETGNGCIDLIGKTRLSEAVDLLSQVDYVVSNDSGLMHICASLRRPMVIIYGPTSPAFTPPLAERSRIIQLSLECQPCFQRTCPLKHWRCMQDISPQAVLSELDEVIDGEATRH